MVLPIHFSHSGKHLKKNTKPKVNMLASILNLALIFTLVKAFITLGDPRNNKTSPTHVGNSTKDGVCICGTNQRSLLINAPDIRSFKLRQLWRHSPELMEDLLRCR